MHRDIVATVAVVLLSTAFTTPGFSQALKTTEWSEWTRAEGADFRWQLRWNPEDSKRVVVMFEIKNRLNERWEGSARVATCGSVTLGSDTKVDLPPKLSRTVPLNTANCGNKNNPQVNHPSLARSKSF